MTTRRNFLAALAAGGLATAMPYQPMKAAKPGKAAQQRRMKGTKLEGMMPVCEWWFTYPVVTIVFDNGKKYVVEKTESMIVDDVFFANGPDGGEQFRVMNPSPNGFGTMSPISLPTDGGRFSGIEIISSNTAGAIYVYAKTGLHVICVNERLHGSEPWRHEPASLQELKEAYPQLWRWQAFTVPFWRDKLVQDDATKLWRRRAVTA